jgi:hypothetical protein
MSMFEFYFQSVTTDYHCIDSYMQLVYCNPCAGRNELPCRINCISTIESCLVNVSLIDDVWRTFLSKCSTRYVHQYFNNSKIYLDAMSNVPYLNGMEKVLSSIGLSISEAVMTFFNAGGVQNKDVDIDHIDEIRFCLHDLF